MNTFRKILSEMEKRGETNLYSSLVAIEEEGLNSWLTLLGQKFNSFNSYPHIKNVEKHIDHAVPISLKQRFNPKEIFLLLSSVDLHDIGKVDPKTKDHARTSCKIIQNDWPQLKIPDENCARKIAAISCSHCWEKCDAPVNYLEKCEMRNEKKCNLLCETKNGPFELDLSYDPEYGELKMYWIAALLRIGDQVDSVSQRAIPKIFLGDDEKIHWRSLILAVEFDRDGHCIKMKTNNFKEDDPDWKYEKEVRDEKGGKKKITYYDFVVNEINQINVILSGWRRPLDEMGLKYRNAFIQSAIPLNMLYRVENGAVLSGDKAIEATIDESLLKNVKNAAIRLSYGIINSNYLSWDILSGECGKKNENLVKLAVNRLVSLSAERNSTTKDKLDLKFLCSNTTWQNKKSIFNGMKLFDEKSFFLRGNTIPTKIEYLDMMMCPEDPAALDGNTEDPTSEKRKKDWDGGIYFPIIEKKGKKIEMISPIISIQGGSGDGKTSLCTQIATNLIKTEKTNKKDPPWIVFYYTLEQDYDRVMLGVNNYGFLDKDQIGKMVFNCEEPGWLEKSTKYLKKENGALFFPRLSPILDDYEGVINYERRFKEIKNCVEWLLKNRDVNKGTRAFFIIDSMTAFSNTPLSRSQLFGLFKFFREKKLPLLFTIERQKTWADENAILSFNIARYLSDIEIRLESNHSDEYFRQTIEVKKTRYNRRILGKHHFKLKSPRAIGTKEIDDRKGIVIYPSIHYHLSVKEGDSKKLKKQKNEIKAIEKKGRLPIGKMIGGEKGKTEIRSFQKDTCFVVSGNHGCHKLAIGINLLLNHRPSAINGKKLIVSFAEEKEIELKRVALLDDISDWRKYLNKMEDDGGRQREKSHADKIWIQEFGDKEKCWLKTIHFRMGQIMPEEVILLLQKFIEKEKKDGKGFNSVLVNDTAHIRNLFPALDQNHMFIPAFVDIIKRNEMYSVFIDVDRDDHIHKALMSAADCRLKMTNDKNKVSFIVNNVRGKDYKQNPYIVTVDEPASEKPILVIKEDEKNNEDAS